MCCSVEEASAALASGFDYVELGASGFNGLSDEWDRTRYRGLPIEATNLFFDSRIRLFGKDRTPYREYVERTVERAASLNVPLMVIGSGGSRRAPEDMDGDRAFVAVAAEVAEIAGEHGIVIAPESLNRTETNVGNDLRSLAIALRDAGVGYTADSYHIFFEWDADGRSWSLAGLMEWQIPFAPSHVHIANLPRDGVSAEDEMLIAFVERLKALGYEGRVSLECSRDAGFDLAAARSVLASLFA